MTERTQGLVPYVPKLALRLLRDSPTPLQEPRVEGLLVCVLLADVSGFTEIVERIAREQPDRGAEQVHEILNGCFGPLTEYVDAAGGEVLRFPGDAALAVWTAPAPLDPSIPLGELVCRTATCGLTLTEKIDRLSVTETIQLRLRVAIGAGHAWAAIVGGVEGQWEMVLQGAPVRQLRGALKAARPGDVVLSPEAATLAGSLLQGVYRDNHFVVRRADKVSPPPVCPPQISLSPPEAVLRSLVPRSVQARLAAGQTAWLAEFRRMTVVFVNVLGLEADEDGRRLQSTMRAVQTVVARFGGSVNQTVVDDKGTTIVLAFGVALGVHEDDPARAVRAALLIREALGQIGIAARMGVTTERIFTGIRGSGSRLEFALIGDGVNLAARLAGIAEDILCDGATRTASQDAISFESLAPARVKGKEDPVQIYRPRSITHRTVKPEGRDSDLIGRTPERIALEGRLAALGRSGQGGVVFVEGEPGIGKSTLISHLLRQAPAHRVRSLVGTADSIEQKTSYMAWRPIVAALLGPEVEHHGGARLQRLKSLLGPEGYRQAPLLNAVLPTPLPENELTSVMNADSRARIARSLLLTMMEAATESTPLLLVLEDAHWMDSASWELAEALVIRLPHVLLVVSLRPLKEKEQPQRRLEAGAETTHVRLEALGPRDIQVLVCRRLNVVDIPEGVASLIYRRAEGQPLFAEELALALRDQGTLEVRERTCRLRSDVKSLAHLRVPDTVNGVVTSRIDQLTPQQQLTLKVASVLGRRFSLTDVTNIHPLGESAENLEDQIVHIAASGLIHTSPARPDEPCLFSHAVIQDVAYQLLPFKQRCELHRRSAVWLEKKGEGNLDALSPLLAHHWERAEIADKAIEYLARAGERALLRDFANREAADFLTRLLALAHKTQDPDQHEVMPIPTGGSVTARAVRLARWERMLTQALFHQGRDAEGMTHLERSLSLLGQKMPASKLALGAEFARGLVVRLAWPPPRPRHRNLSGLTRQALLEMVETYETLGAAAYYTGRVRSDQGMVAFFRSVRVAERVGPSAQLSRAYSTFSNVVAMFRRPKLAHQYFQLALAIAEEIGDREATFMALRRGQLPLYITAHWDEAMTSLDRALELGAALGNVHERQVMEYQRARIHFNQGLIDEALGGFRRLLSSARRYQTAVNELWALVSIGEALFRQGHVEEAITCAEETLHVAEKAETTDQNCRFQAYGLLAAAWLRKGGPERGREYVDGAISAAEAGARFSFVPQIGFSGVAEVLFALWDRGGHDARSARTTLRSWLRTLRLVGFCRPILEPWDLVFRASWNGRCGRRRRAARRARRAMVLADRMRLAYESGYARMELARWLSPADSERSHRLQQACEIFRRIGATGDLRAAQEFSG